MSIDKKRLTDLNVNPTFGMTDFKAVPKEWRDKIPEYVWRRERAGGCLADIAAAAGSCAGVRLAGARRRKRRQ